MSQRTVLTDIEGTTSSIAFVHEVLFPYARRALPDFLREQADRPEERVRVRAEPLRVQRHLRRDAVQHERGHAGELDAEPAPRPLETLWKNGLLKVFWGLGLGQSSHSLFPSGPKKRETAWI